MNVQQKTPRGSKYYYTKDHEGSTRELVDGSGNILTRYNYDAYGRTITVYVSGTHDATFQWAGMQVHPTSGQYFAVLRVYDPDTGRWRSKDPIGENGGFNLYQYCANDPANWTDELGLKPCSEAISDILQKYGMDKNTANKTGQDLVNTMKKAYYNSVYHGFDMSDFDSNRREVGVTVSSTGAISPPTTSGWGQTLDYLRPEPPGTVLGAHTHPWEEGPFASGVDKDGASRGDKIQAAKLGRPEAFYGMNSDGTYGMGIYDPKSGITIFCSCSSLKP